MCKKYKIEVISKYGMYTKEADTYNEIMELVILGLLSDKKLNNKIKE